MRKVVLFIAMSLDGYIADRNGSVDWLGGQCNEAPNEDAYSEFIKDTILGSGVRLFGALDAECKLKLIETRNYNGIVEVVYEKR